MTTPSLHRRIAEVEEGGEKAAILTVVHVTGSTPRAPGARMLVFADGRIEGTIGGGRVEHEAIASARSTLETGRPQLLEFKLTQDLGMCCGGAMSIFIEAVVRSPRLIVFGAGHVGAALAHLASYSGFVVHVVDERPELLTPERLPQARTLHDDPDDPALPFSGEAFVVIATHDHALDQALLEKALRRPHGWVGLIGSSRKAELTKARLEAKGFAGSDTARFRCPIGAAIGAETPEEIAVSILAELVAARRGAPREIHGALRLETKSASKR